MAFVTLKDVTQPATSPVTGVFAMPQPHLDDYAEIDDDDARLAAYHNPPNAPILAQIRELEAQQTPRRLREALAGTDNGWLASLNTQIATLRATLTPST